MSRCMPFDQPGRALVALGLLCGVAAAAAAQPGPPRLSPQATVSQTVGAATIEIVYSRPSVRGRTIWGELVPYGEVWRTGANEATVFTISHHALIGGEQLPAGSYALFTVPGESTWKVIFNGDSEQWGAFNHDPAKDVLVLRVSPATVPMQETFAITIPAVSENKATVELAWERTAVRFDVAFNAVAAVLAKAKAEIAEAGEGSRVAFNWARYFQGRGEHLETALGWAGAAAEAADHYWTHSVKARILAGLGRADEAREAAAHALTVVDEAPNAEFARQDAERLKTEMAGW